MCPECVERLQVTCSHCGCLITDGNYRLINDEDPICLDCVDNYCTTCERCGTLIYDDDVYGDDDHCLCEHCYENHYTRCDNCDRVMHVNDSYGHGDECLCYDCFNEKSSTIHDYSFKPEPIFYGKGERYFGVELEIDIGGHDDDNAQSILEVGNVSDDCIYIKSDGSLNEGMEIVTHPMSLEYHMGYYWEDVLNECIHLGYRSHQTSTCGLHIHVNRSSLGDFTEHQEATISRILYFVEQHWNELLKFSRRSESAMNRWAARYGYESSPKKLLDKAKERYGRYSAVNLCNKHTIEFRMFRGTLKLNTLLATLQLVNRICDVAFTFSDKEVQELSWSDFVATINEPELIQYLKERRLYINDEITTEEDM
ncbi:MAG: amidoligase family protein [Oscillospiraceae bacterium]|nr:amidoligase family protein [Oscillospiraceae bacterium]